MRWTHLAALLITTGLILTSPAANCLAETPSFSANRPQILTGRMFAGQNWWTRYGEPVNSTALAQAEASPSDKTYAGPMPIHGDGYIYGPDSCDCSPPCIWHLWAGYYQNPKRCKQHHFLGKGCGACGNGCSACGPCGSVFGKGCCDQCGCSAASCSCGAPLTCTTAAADCGCKPVCGKCRHCHLGHKFMAHWNCGCNSCSAPVSCGCATPAAPAYPSEKQATSRPPIPLPESAVLYSRPLN